MMPERDGELGKSSGYLKPREFKEFATLKTETK